MACLDTSFLIDILRGRREVDELKDELWRTERFLSVAAPTIMELWLGALLSKCSEKEKLRISELITTLTVLPFDERSAKEAAEIESELIRNGHVIETEDIMIGAISIVHGERLVTRDQHYARIPGLRVLKY